MHGTNRLITTTWGLQKDGDQKTNLKRLTISVSFNADKEQNVAHYSFIQQQHFKGSQTNSGEKKAYATQNIEKKTTSVNVATNTNATLWRTYVNGFRY